MLTFCMLRHSHCLLATKEAFGVGEGARAWTVQWAAVVLVQRQGTGSGMWLQVVAQEERLRQQQNVKNKADVS